LKNKEKEGEKEGKEERKKEREIKKDKASFLIISQNCKSNTQPYCFAFAQNYESCAIK